MSSKPSPRRIFLARLLLLTAAGGLLAGCQRAQAPAPRPVVLVTEVIQEDVPIYSDWIGTLDGLINAQIHAQVSGYLLSQAYQEGTFVRKGALLFEIDPRPFQAALDMARGQLAQAEAQLGKTELAVKRYTPLARTSAISQEELDDAVQANMAAQAAVASAQAQVQQAALHLEFTRITAPIDGIAGIAEAQVGDLVGPASPPLTVVSTVNPIKVYFPISEHEYMLAMENRPPPADAGAEQPVNVLELILANNRIYPQRGFIFSSDRQVNAKTGTIRIAGLFPNPDNILRPGQYAKVRMLVLLRRAALLVPQRAVLELQGRHQIAVVDQDDRVSMRSVEMGERSGQLWVILQGVQPGERVIVEGIQKVREGSQVDPQPYVPAAAPGAPEPTPAPAP